MFSTIRMSRKAAVYSLLAVLMLLGVCLMLLRSGAPDTVLIGGEPYPLAVEDDADVEAFLAACGISAEGCVTDRTITVPKTWNDTYTAYNDLQVRQGFTLVPYKGEEARELVYAAADSDDCVTLLIADGRIIAAHRSTMLRGDALRPVVE